MTENEDHDSSNGAEGGSSIVLQELISRAKALLAELQTFKLHLKSIREEPSVEIAHFRGTVQSELAMLSRLFQKVQSVNDNVGGLSSALFIDNESRHIARSSNLPFLETIWRAAKRSTKLLALQKRVYWSKEWDTGALTHSMRGMELNGGRTSNPSRKAPKAASEGSAVVDIISDNGRQWSKISLLTNTRLLFDLAKQGWESGGSSEDEFDEDGEMVEQNQHASDGDHDVPLLKTAKDLTRAAKAFRVRTQHPHVHLILPRITPRETAEIDAVLDAVRATGAILHCGSGAVTTLPLEDAMQTMAPDPMSSFSDTLNIDCTILLAIVSEFSHARVAKEAWFHTALQRQVEVEGNENLLPSILYPAMASHRMVCTHEAAKRMREIVDTIGTASEKGRTVILMGDDKSRSPDQLLEDMREWSAYAVPDCWNLPIQVVQYDEVEATASLPPQVDRIKAHMTSINQSVFLYGWSIGYTTITSNRTVMKQIESDLNSYEDLEEGIWPKIWLCPTARSLVGKEKRGAKKSDSANGDSEKTGTKDPLCREGFRRNGLDVLSMREGREVMDLRPTG